MKTITYVLLLILSVCLAINVAEAQHDLSGIWQGVLIQGGNTLPFSMRLTQSGSNIAGNSIVIHPYTGSYYANRYLTGNFINDTLSFTQTGSIADVPPPFQYWCFLNGTLTYDSTSLNETLTGPWYSSSCSPGTIELWRLKTTGTFFCPGNPIVINASGANLNLKWYADSMKQNLVYSGYSLSPNITASKTYYVTQTHYNTESPVASVFVEIKSASDPTCGTLPLSFVSFSATQNKNGILLHWKTAQEKNCQYFVIEKSMDANAYQAIGQLTASGVANYEYADNSVMGENNYYRIKEIDKDGKQAYSKIISVSIPQQNEFTIYPNPVMDNIFIRLQKNKAGTATIVVTDIQGKVLKQEIRKLYSGINILSINTSCFDAGTYMLQIKTPGPIQHVFVKR